MREESATTMRLTKRLTHIILLGLLVVGLLAAAPAVLAQDGGDVVPPGEGVTDDEVNAIAEQLYCPVCDNIPLDVCGTPACADWRDEIRVMLVEGRSEDEIKTYFVDRYGRRVLATPQREGIDLVVWVLPPLIVLAGAAVLVFTLRRMAPGALDAQAEPGRVTGSYEGLNPEMVARLEREVEEFSA